MTLPKKTLFAFLPILLLSVALAVRVAELPFDASEAAVSEATTNVPFAVDFGAMSRVSFTLALDASPTNAVEVSVGTDADGKSLGSVPTIVYPRINTNEHESVIIREIRG